MKTDPPVDHANNRKTKPASQCSIDKCVTNHLSFSRNRPTSFQMTRSCASCMTRVPRHTRKEPTPIPSGPWGKSDFCVQKVGWASDLCLTGCGIVHSFSEKFHVFEKAVAVCAPVTDCTVQVTTMGDMSLWANCISSSVYTEFCP